MIFSFSNLTGVLSMCHRTMIRKSQLSNLLSKMPAILVIFLSSCMLWQCSTCLTKFLASPTAAQVDLRQNTGQPPIAITICNKGLEMNYDFPELHAIDIRQQPDSDWQNVWPVDKNSSTYASDKNFATLTRKNLMRLCKTVNFQAGTHREVRLRHFYSGWCKLNKMEVYLHSPGQFHSAEFAILMPKWILVYENNYILQLSIESIISLPSADFNCSEDENTQTLDSCLLEEAFRAANISAGCLPNNIT
jgi:hypothetical protein